ncbi:MAG: uroporphyrinogen-III synthase [Deltaproteobacteria bacterium]|nr:uroporphyrinogen-III synthase [Deltaproteobacteria bacterium]
MGRPLEGKRVLVTRTAEQAEGFNQALRAAGAEPVLIPLIGFEATDNAAELDAALSVLSDYDAILLTSQNALSFFLAHAKRMDEDWVAKAPPAWCVGPSTLAAASEAGFRAEALAEGSYDAKGMLEVLLQREDVAGKRYLMPRAEQGRDVLPKGLRAAGATVDLLITYRTVAARQEAKRLTKLLVDGELDALTFASPSAVRFFCELISDEARAVAGTLWIAAIGGITEAALRDEGFDPQVVASKPDVEVLVEELAQTVEQREAG